MLLQELFADGPASRADLARSSGLTRVTVSDLVAELIAEGLLEELGAPAESRVGKPPTLVGLVPDANEAIMVAAFMAAANTGVTKTPLGSTLVVTEMAGFQLLPTTLLAVIVSFFLTSEVGLIHSQRERDVVGRDDGHRDEPGPGGPVG